MKTVMKAVMKTDFKAEDELAELLAASPKLCLAVSHLSAPHESPHGYQRRDL